MSCSKAHYMEEVREAILRLLECLPDIRITKDSAINFAIRPVVLPAEQREEAHKVIRQLARSLPTCYGVRRKARYWQILREYLYPEELVPAYLKKFPPLVTMKQLKSISWYLRTMGFGYLEVRNGLQRFLIVPNAVKEDVRWP